MIPGESENLHQGLVGLEVLQYLGVDVVHSTVWPLFL